MGFNHSKQNDFGENMDRIKEELQIINSLYDHMLVIFGSNQKVSLSSLLMY